MTDLSCDVAVVGAGPTGLTIANLLGACGLRVVLLERNRSTVQEPRAVSIDDESLRTVQALGLVDRVLEDVALDYGSTYLTPKGVCFAKVEPSTREFGFPRRNAFSQPLFEAVLRNGLQRYPNVIAFFGCECQTLQERADDVELQLAGLDGQPGRLLAKYVVGCDGGRSTVRRIIGSVLVGSTYRQRWLIVDLGATQENFRETRVLCDPDRPLLTLPGPHGTRRYEFMLADNESDAEAQSDSFVRALLAKYGPDEHAPLIRKQVYTFHARIADRWRVGRVFLAGDAAHLSPPFAGQGMNSGLRDSVNLAWKLAEVLAGRMGPGLLDTYEAERSPHAAALIRVAVNLGRVMMPTSRLKAKIVQSAFRGLGIIPQLRSYISEMRYKPKPFYRTGFVAQDDGLGLTGRMLPQPLAEVEAGKVFARLDDLLGNSFALIAYGPNSQRAVLASTAMQWNFHDLRTMAVLPAQYNVDQKISDVDAVRDVEGHMAALTAEGRDICMLVRPDRHIAAAVLGCDRSAIERLHTTASKLIAGTNTQRRPVSKPQHTMHERARVSRICATVS